MKDGLRTHRAGLCTSASMSNPRAGLADSGSHSIEDYPHLAASCSSSGPRPHAPSSCWPARRQPWRHPPRLSAERGRGNPAAGENNPLPERNDRELRRISGLIRGFRPSGTAPDPDRAGWCAPSHRPASREHRRPGCRASPLAEKHIVHGMPSTRGCRVRRTRRPGRSFPPGGGPAPARRSARWRGGRRRCRARRIRAPDAPSARKSRR